MLNFQTLECLKTGHFTGVQNSDFPGFQTFTVIFSTELVDTNFDRMCERIALNVVRNDSKKNDSVGKNENINATNVRDQNVSVRKQKRIRSRETVCLDCSKTFPLGK